MDKVIVGVSATIRMRQHGRDDHERDPSGLASIAVSPATCYAATAGAPKDAEPDVLSVKCHSWPARPIAE